MRNVLIAAVLGVVFVGAVGCKSSGEKKSGTEAAAVDDCAMCPGTQTASANGTCPKCGMKVKG